MWKTLTLSLSHQYTQVLKKEKNTHHKEHCLQSLTHIKENTKGKKKKNKKKKNRDKKEEWAKKQIKQTIKKEKKNVRLIGELRKL